MSDDFRKGARSAKAPEEQNWPTLSVVNEETTSGALSPPVRSAWLILSSVMLPCTLMWMLGCAFSNRATLSLIAFSSLGADQPCQKLIVTSLLASSVAPEELWPVHALASRDSAAVAATAAAAFVRRDTALYLRERATRVWVAAERRGRCRPAGRAGAVRVVSR